MKAGPKAPVNVKNGKVSQNCIINHLKVSTMCFETEWIFCFSFSVCLNEWRTVSYNIVNDS